MAKPLTKAGKWAYNSALPGMMRATLPFSLGGLLAALLLLGACGQSEQPNSSSVDPADEGIGPASLRNVVLITMHGVRADHLTPYGAPVTGTTPNLDQLAAVGVRLQQNISCSPNALPAHASMMTGLYPYHHGARSNHITRLPEQVTTLAEVLRDHGMRTGAVVSAAVLDSGSGLDQGFEVYDDNLIAGSERHSFRLRETPGLNTVERANAWLSTVAADEPFFLWVELHEAHAPFEASPAFLEQAQGNPYDAEIAAADEKIGRLLASLIDKGVFNDTLVVVTADHGQSLMEHEEANHGLFLHDATLRVPAVFTNPLLRQGAVLGPVSSQADLMPTIAELVGATPPTNLDGVSLAAQLRDPSAPEPERLVYSETLLPLNLYGAAPLYALRTSDGRFVSGARDEMFSLVRDPGETQDVTDLIPDDAERFRNALQQLHAGGQRTEVRDLLAGLTEANRQRLQEIGRPFGPPPANGARPDPRDLQPWLARQRAALQAAAEGEVGATAQLEALLAEQPLDRGILTVLDSLYREQGATDKALEIRRRLAALPDSDVLDWLGLADLERELGQDIWQQDWELATQLNPSDPTPYLLQAQWAEKAGDDTGFQSAIDQALAVEPNNLRALLSLASHAQRRGDLDAAKAGFEKVLTVNPRVFAAQLELGVMYENQQRPSEAVPYYQMAGEIRPDDFFTWRHLGSCYLQLKQFKLAMAAFEKATVAGDPAYLTDLNLGLLRVQHGLFAEAVAPLEAAVAKKKNDPQAMLALAVAYDRTDRKAEAEQTFRAIQQAAPEQVAQLCQRNPAFEQLRQSFL